MRYEHVGRITTGEHSTKLTFGSIRTVHSAPYRAAATVIVFMAKNRRDASRGSHLTSISRLCEPDYYRTKKLGVILFCVHYPKLNTIKIRQ